MLTAIYTADQAHQAAVARRACQWEDPELLKLGDTSLSVDLDLQRIYVQTTLCAEYINYTRRYVELQATPELRDTKELHSMMDRMEDLWKQLSRAEEKTLQSIDLNWFIEHPDEDYTVLLQIPPIFRPRIRLKAFKDDPWHPITLRIFEDNDVSATRSAAENRAIGLIKSAYTIMSCNDPGQRLVGQLKLFLQDFGVHFENQQVFHGEDN